MSKASKYFIAGALAILLLLIFIAGRNCGRTVVEDEWQKKFDTQKKLTEENDKHLAIAIKEKEEIIEGHVDKINELQRSIDSHETEVVKVKEESDKQLAELEKQDETLQNFQEKYENMTQQRDLWKKRSEDIEEGKDKIIFDLKEKFKIAFDKIGKEKDDIIFAWSQRYEKERTLRSIGEKLVDEKDRKIARMNLEKWVARTLISGFAVKIAYDVVK